MSVQGQVVVVTGSAKGIGRFIAGTFAQAGARMVLADVDADRLNKTAAEMRDAGTDVLAVKTDVSNEADVQRLMDQAAERFGQIDVLINNAAIVPHFQWGLTRWALVGDMDKTFWDRVIQTNLGGTFLCTKHALRYMRPRRSGHVISLYGGAGLTPGGGCAYMVSKDAIRTFTSYVAEEERENNVCVLVMAPGATIATEDAPDEARQRMPSPEVVGNRFVLAAEAGLDLSGKLLALEDGQLVLRDGG